MGAQKLQMSLSKKTRLDCWRLSVAVLCCFHTSTALFGGMWGCRYSFLSSMPYFLLDDPSELWHMAVP